MLTKYSTTQQLWNNLNYNIFHAANESQWQETAEDGMAGLQSKFQT